jgi:hypothetical protein
MPPSRQAVVAPSLALHADDVAPEIAGALAAQGLHPAEQTSLGWLHRRRAESGAGNASYRRGTPPWSRNRRGAGAASPTADAAKRRSVAARCSRKILPCAPAAQFILSLRTRPRSNYACVWGCEGNEAFIVGDYRGEYWR